jgi:hypothetical protein
MSGIAGEPFVIVPGGGRTIDLGGFVMHVKATGDETGGTFSLLEADEPAGFGPPLHIHHDAAEAFYVLEGEYIIFLKGARGGLPGGIVHLHPRRSAARVPGRRDGQPEAELLHARGDDRLFR